MDFVIKRHRSHDFESECVRVCSVCADGGGDHKALRKLVD